MAYSQELAGRVSHLLKNRPGHVSKKMFGGICFLLHGNMACGILGEDLIVRVGPDNYHAALAQPDSREFDITGRPMNGWVMVAPSGHETDQALSSWVEKGVAFALTLPPK